MHTFQTIHGIVTAPSTTITAVTMQGTDSLTVQSFDDNKKSFLRGLWNLNQTAGQVRLRSPRMHDISDNMTFNAPAADPQNLLNSKCWEQIYSQDILQLGLSGSGTAGDIELVALLMEYEQIRGLDPNYITPQELGARFEHLIGVRNAIVTGTAGAYGTAAALNATIGTFKPNVDYAVLGYTTGTNCVSVVYTGFETGNVNYGGPGNATKQRMTKEWFIDQSNLLGKAAIPVVNAANIANFKVNVLVDENGADPVVTTFLAQLNPSRRN
jgi:hypothetical protein